MDESKMWGRDKKGTFHLVQDGMVIEGPRTYCGKPDRELKAFHFTSRPDRPCPMCVEEEEKQKGSRT